MPLTVRMMLVVKTCPGCGRYERFTSPKSKHIKTDIIHCIHVTNNGASNLTVSPLNSALFTNTVTIETILRKSKMMEIVSKIFVSYDCLDHTHSNNINELTNIVQQQHQFSCTLSVNYLLFQMKTLLIIADSKRGEDSIDYY